MNSYANNSTAAVTAATNAATGYAGGLTNTANGRALGIFAGGAQVSVVDISSATITVRAVGYLLTGGGPSFAFDGAITELDGDIMFVQNDTGSPASFEGVSLAVGEGKTIIRFTGGVYRGF